MPLPPEAEAIRAELQTAYTRVGQELIAELERIAEDPTQARYRARLTAQAEAVAQALDEVDVQARTWASRRLPEVYQYGAMEAAQATGQRFTWSQLHTDAMAEIASDTYSDLLSATRYVRRDVRRFIREAVRERANFAVAGGQTSTEAGKQLARTLRERGIRAVRYSNGAKHGIEDYADVAIRTAVAKANVMGSINASLAGGITYMQCVDGAACHLYSHKDGPLANGLVAPISTALNYPLGHPRCARSWSPMPLVRTDEQAKAEMTVPEEERQALARAEDERARVRTVSGRLTASERHRRLRERERRLRARQQRVTSRRSSE